MTPGKRAQTKTDKEHAVDAIKPGTNSPYKIDAMPEVAINT
jgi:hypothetical protein